MSVAKSEAVKVVIRVRPLAVHEEGNDICVEADNDNVLKVISILFCFYFKI
jgi:hypothetical protein